ncbi:unnamed protein product [Blepharisma stoltei]|uniref:Uncharacterized protein n=1 Tax=Blepharisma stoltei TaxID=1481888 RepID=A0AAU9IBX3_9CILI|nr:unnamed protein product [Blepharisma stoltei]
MSERPETYFSKARITKTCALDKELSLKLDLQSIFTPNSSRGFNYNKRLAHASCYSNQNSDRYASSTINMYDTKCRLSSTPKPFSKSKGPIIRAQEDFDNFYNSITPSSRSKILKQEAQEAHSLNPKSSFLLNPNFSNKLIKKSEKISDLLPLDTLKKLKDFIKENKITEDEMYTQELREFALEVLSQKLKEI